MISISELVNSLPKRFTASDRIKNFERSKSLQLIENISKAPGQWLPKLGIHTEIQSVDETDGFRMVFVDGDIVHLRPSGNAPELRCYAESRIQITAERLVIDTLNSIAKL